MKLYHDRLMDYYRTPRHRGIAAPVDFYAVVHNPSCGDSVMVGGTIQNGIITSIAFEGTGCIISQSVASQLMEHAHTKSIPELQALDTPFMQNLVGMELGPNRLRCALIALEAVHEALSTYLAKQNDTHAQ